MDTTLQYRMLTKNYGNSLTRVAKEPQVKADTDYYWKHIGQVKTVDDFLKDSRLFNYAMKAYGMEDMSYAKGLMKKVLVGGVSDRKSYANKLVDTRYRDFAREFDFSGLAADTKATVEKFELYEPKIDPVTFTTTTKIVSYSQILADPQIRNLVLTALDIPKPNSDYVYGKDDEADKALVNQLTKKFPIENFADKDKCDTLIAAYQKKVSFGAMVDDKARQKVVTQYLQHSLEVESGEQNDGVRLALYFARKGKSITSYYDVLADPALTKVVQTALGLPATFSSAPLESQVRTYQAKYDVKNFSDPKKLDAFIRRFTGAWDATQSDPSQDSSALAILMSNPITAAGTKRH